VFAYRSLRRGSLTVAGTGIRPGLQTTQETRDRIRRADKVLFALAENAPIEWLRELNPSAESMAHLYWPGRPYLDVYADMVATILTWVRHDLDVCAVSYGHPGVLDQSSREAVRRAGAEGYETRFLPGISTLDCLFADLELDPGVEGCQMFDATDFLVNGRRPDVAVPLILFQISLIGVTRATSEVNRNGLRILAERISHSYGAEHEVVIYEATPFPVGHATVERGPVSQLAEAGVTGMSSLFVPPAAGASRDLEMANRLGLSS
jgi:Tetrapyrrole (Corrin/Porphyrin) Methylases